MAVLEGRMHARLERTPNSCYTSSSSLPSSLQRILQVANAHSACFQRTFNLAFCLSCAVDKLAPHPAPLICLSIEVYCSETNHFTSAFVLVLQRKALKPVTMKVWSSSTSASFRNSPALKVPPNCHCSGFLSLTRPGVEEHFWTWAEVEMGRGSPRSVF